MGSDRRKIPLMISLFIVSSMLDLIGIGLIGPYITLLIYPESVHEGKIGQIVEFFGITQDQHTIIFNLGFIIIAIFSLKAIASIGITKKMIAFTHNLQLRLRTFLMDCYQNTRYEEYLKRNSSEYIYNVESLTQQYAGSVVGTGLRLVSDMILVSVLFCLLLWTNGTALLLFILIFGPAVLVYDRIFRNRVKSFGQKANDCSTSMIQAINEGVKGLKVIRIYGVEHYFYQKVLNGAEGYAKNAVKFQIISAAPRYVLEWLMILFVVLMVFVTISIGYEMKNIVPTLGIFGATAVRLLPSINSFTTTLMGLRYSRNSVSRLYADVIQSDKTKSIKTHTLHHNYQDTFNSLSLNHLSYRYPQGKQNALNEINFVVNVGESIGLIGPSGSGKTTLVDIMLGLLNQQSGVININERPLSESIDEWRAQVAYLPQDVFLMDDTLLRNVAFGLEDAQINAQKAEESLRQARLYDLISQLPNGMETNIGENGARLSGGQRQRVAIARAFYHNRNILVMDEATSSLDNKTEQEIVEEISYLKGRKTMIVIAHRLSTVQSCDRIYKLSEGQIIEVGTPAEILTN
jgi:ATP-binding cassette, subfamily B, bacterial PglK